MNDPQSLNEALRQLIGQPCWAVTYSPNTWTNMSLNLGKRVPKRRVSPRRTVPPELQYFDSEYSIYVEGAWSIETAGPRGTFSIEHSEAALEVVRTKLTGSRLVDAFVLPGSGATFSFSGQSTLIVKKESRLGEPSEAVVSIFWPDRYVVCDSAGAIHWHLRRSRVNPTESGSSDGA